MKELREFEKIATTLHANEIRDVYSRLSTSRKKSNSVKLINTILLKKQFSVEDYQLKIYGKQNNLAFAKLVKRTFNKMLDVLAYRDNIEFNDAYDRRAKSIFLMERNLTLSGILRFRSNYNISSKLLEKVIEQCKFYEHYNLLIYALDRKLKWLPVNASKKIRIDLDKEISNYMYEGNYLKTAYELFSSVIRIKLYEYNEQMRKDILRSIQKLNLYVKKSNSVYFRYYLYYIKIQFFNCENRSDKSLMLVNKLLNLISTNKSLNSRYKLGNAFLNRGLIYRLSFEFEKSIDDIVEARKYLRDYVSINNAVYEEMFLSYFYLGQLNKIKYYIQFFEKEAKNLSSSIANIERIDFYISVFYTLEGRFKEAIKKLSSIQYSNADEYLNLEIRILTLINLIEVENYDAADKAVVNFKKFITRAYNKRSKILVINQKLNILSKLSANGYDFIRTFNIKKVKAELIKHLIQRQKTKPEMQ